MGVKITDTNRIPDLIKSLEKLNRMSIELGVFGSDDSFMAMIATVHEFGMTIKPKGQFLAIPTEKAQGKSPRDFNDLNFISIQNGKKGLLVREEGQGGNGARSDIYFILVRSVTIPERSFLRSTFDEKEKEWTRFAARQFAQVLVEKITVDIMFERLGQRMVADIQKTIRNMDSPPNAPLTAQNKGSSSPLIDTGRLRQSITYRVVRD